MMTGLSAQRMIAAALAGVVTVMLASAEAFAFRGMARTSIHPMGGNFSGGQGLTRPGFNGGGEQHHVPQPGPQPQPPGPNPPNPDPQPHPPGPGPHPPGPPPPGYWGGGWYVDPVAAAVSVGVTAAVVGSMVATLPPACAAVIVGGVTYEQCGGTWYQPQYVGAQVQYVVVTAPQ